MAITDINTTFSVLSLLMFLLLLLSCLVASVLRDGVPIIPLGEGGPEAYRLGHDIMKTLTYWQQVFDNQGLNVQMNVPGHRGDEARAANQEAALATGKSSTRGGKRTKKSEMVNSWLHPDAEYGMDKFFKGSMETFNKGKYKCIDCLQHT